MYTVVIRWLHILQSDWEPILGSGPCRQMRLVQVVTGSGEAGSGNCDIKFYVPAKLTLIWGDKYMLELVAVCG